MIRFYDCSDAFWTDQCVFQLVHALLVVGFWLSDHQRGLPASVRQADGYLRPPGWSCLCEHFLRHWHSHVRPCD